MRADINTLTAQNIKHCGPILSVDDSFRNNDTVKVTITDNVTNKTLLMIVDKIETKNNSIVCGKDDEFDRALDSKQTGFVFLCIFLVILSMIGCSVMADIIGYKGNSE